METKDILTICLSGSAFALSLFSTFMTFNLKKYEMQRSARSQLNGILGETIALIAEIWKLMAEDDSKKDVVYYQTWSALTQKTSTFARQAVYFVQQEPESISDVEYGVIAQSLVVAGDYQLADEFWKKAIGKSPNDFYRVVNTRSYADFLFMQGKHELGREQYQKSLRMVDNTTDFNKRVNGYTYHMWMVNEAGSSQYDESDRCYRQAKGIYESIGSNVLKRDPLLSLEQARNKLFIAPLTVTAIPVPEGQRRIPLTPPSLSPPPNISATQSKSPDLNNDI